MDFKTLIKPRHLYFEVDTLTDTYGRFIAEPFQRLLQDFLSTRTGCVVPIASHIVLSDGISSGLCCIS